MLHVYFLVPYFRENEKYWRGVYDGKPGLIVASHVEAASEKPEVGAALCRPERDGGRRWRGSGGISERGRKQTGE